MKIITIIIIAICFDPNSALNIMLAERETKNLFEYVLLDRDHPCARTCVKNAVPMVCRYTFKIEFYYTMSKACGNCPFNNDDCFKPDCIPTDGSKRTITVVNRRLPGPSIDVCLGDEVIVDVINELSTDSTTIHWHGHHQRDSPYMDGVPFVTQCPITPGSTFRYHFSANNGGTHFWHSHSGLQRSDGAFGSFVVHVPKEDNPHYTLYDYDLSSHVISILDWTDVNGLDKFSSHHHSSGNNKPDTILVNGLGKLLQFTNENNESVYTPTARFNVDQGFRYRFRVINAGFLNCPIQISVDNHTLTIISSDGFDINATNVESFVTYAGERFDFILNANQPVGNYWIRFKGLMDGTFTNTFQTSVLHYNSANNNDPEGTATYDNSDEKKVQLNPLNKGTEQVDTKKYVSLPQLQSLNKWDDSLQEKADFQYYVSYDFYKIDNPHFHSAPSYGFKNFTNKPSLQLLTPQLNYISMKLQPSPLLSQRDEIGDDKFCNETSVKNCDQQFCECTHVVNIPLNTVVEMIIIDKGYAYDANHPFHLHGGAFRVVAMEKVGPFVNVSQIRQMDLDGKIKRNLIDAPIKDTVPVPDGGYTIIRFKATNPGYWLFHCHIEFHAEIGMSLVFKIGEHKDLPPVPFNFPRCGNFVPTSWNSTAEEDCDKLNYLTSIFQSWFPNLHHDGCSKSNSNVVTLQMSLLIGMLFLRFL